MHKSIAFSLSSIIFWIIATSSMCAHAQDPVEIPPFPKHNLTSDFPKHICDNAFEPIKLRKCRLELDIFLKTTLEGFNQEIKEYRTLLNQSSAHLEELNRQGKLRKSVYTKANKKIANGLAATSQNGKIMKPYFDNLVRYRQTEKWVEIEIRKIENGHR